MQYVLVYVVGIILSRFILTFGGKSEKKCQEYSKYVFTLDYGAGGGGTPKMVNVSECHNEATPLVVGGVKASFKEFPHMVLIGFGESEEKATWMCGGTLISEYWVLTAAHCENSRDFGPAKFARIGLLDVTGEDNEDFQSLKIVQRINHPKYEPPSRYDDISLFKLDKPVIFSGYSRPACLNLDTSFAFKKAIATGWGKLHYSASTGSKFLMKVALSIIDSDICNATFKVDVGGRAMAHGVIETQICAGEMEGGRDTCQGDSGGPLQTVLETPYCMYSVIGITSFGKFCGFKNAPAVYTRVAFYVPWIESIVWP